MIKDKYYYEACEDAREIAITRWHNKTDAQVEAHAEVLRNLANVEIRHESRRPAANRYE